MAVYPFYVKADSSSRKSLIAGGVRSKRGHMTTSIYQRDEGAITTPYEISQYSILDTRDDGKEHIVLVTEVSYLGNVIPTHITNY